MRWNVLMKSDFDIPATRFISCFFFLFVFLHSFQLELFTTVSLIHVHNTAWCIPASWIFKWMNKQPIAHLNCEQTVNGKIHLLKWGYQYFLAYISSSFWIHYTDFISLHCSTLLYIRLMYRVVFRCVLFSSFFVFRHIKYTIHCFYILENEFTLIRNPYFHG